MQKIILFTMTLLVLFITFLQAEEQKDYALVSMFEMRGETIVYESNRSDTLFSDINVTFSLLKSPDTAINIANIKMYDKDFSHVAKEETFQETNTIYWLKVDLGTAFPSGRFVYSYADSGFSGHTIAKHQKLEKFKLLGVQHMKFSYDKNIDSTVYYFKLIPHHYKIPFRFIYISTPKTFYNHIEKSGNIKMILGLILGLILMAAIYNAAMYYYNRDISFLYYTMMQFFMLLVLYNFSGELLWNEDSYFCRNISYESIVSLITALFATTFTMSFLETKKHLPKTHTLLKIGIYIISIDLVLSIFDRSYLVEYFLLPFLMLPFLYTGYKRIRQGYKPAQFYLAGWTVLNVAVFFNIFMVRISFLLIDPLYIGSAIEAILFSLALSYKIRLVSKEKEQQKELMVHQSKLASMGEMIGNIAHQWRQPLTHLSYTFMNIQDAQKHGKLDEKYLTSKIKEASSQLDFMSQTIDDFKDFYTPHKDKEYFSLVSATQETLKIMKNTLKHSDIVVELVIKEDTQLHNYKNEYKQVLLNLLSNANDVLVERVTKTPKVTIFIDKNIVSIKDNAGGIKKDILKRIYEPYFTTKEGNSGIGLYMSKMIMERNIKGQLNVENTQDGTCFSMVF